MSLYFDELFWLEWVVDKIEQKHGVTPGEVEDAFTYSPFKLVQAGFRKYKYLGRTDGGRYLIVIFVWEGPNIVVISTRDMDQRERRIYRSK